MPVPDLFIIAPDFTVCEYCGKSYADTPENMHRVQIEKDGARRIHEACVHCIARAKALAAEMQEKEPDAGWEAMSGDEE